METLELPLVLFTLLSQMAIGLATFAAVRQWAVVDGPSLKVRHEWQLVLALVALGVMAAFFHLGKPLGVVRMLANLSTAWLSREILAFGAFGVLAAALLFMAYTQRASGWLIKLTAAVGLLAVLSSGLAYAAPGLDALHNVLPLVFFVLTAFTLGLASAVYVIDAKYHAQLVSFFEPGLSASLVINFAVPFIWLSGSAVTQATGRNFLASPLHWLHIAALLVSVLVVRRTKRIPVWLPLVLLVGEFLGRLAFFSLVVSSSANMGGLY